MQNCLFQKRIKILTQQLAFFQRCSRYNLLFMHINCGTYRRTHRAKKDVVVLMNESRAALSMKAAVLRFWGGTTSLRFYLPSALYPTTGFGLRSIFDCDTRRCTRGYRSQFLVESRRTSFFGLLLI